MVTNKTRRIYCRMSEAEFSLFRKQVSKTYLSNSEYMRRLLLNHQLRIQTKEEVDWSNFVVLSLSQINNNINQIARVMNVLKYSDSVVIGSVAQRQLNQVQEILREWVSFESSFIKTFNSK